MSDPDHIDEDEVLRRMLNTPPKPHKPKDAEGQGSARKGARKKCD